MKRAVSVLTSVFWASVALLVTLLALSWLGYDLMVGLLGEKYFVRLAGVLMGLVMASSAFLTWHEFRTYP